MKDKNQFWQGQGIIDRTFIIEGAYMQFATVSAEMDSFAKCEGLADGKCDDFNSL